MHFERRYKICICSVILGDLEYFRSYKGFGIISRNFLCKLAYYESEKYFYSSLHHIFEFENVRLPFSYANSLIRSVKCEKLNFRKSLGIY